MEPNDLSPTLGGGLLPWTFEERRPTTVFKMPATLAAEARAREALAEIDRINQEIRETDARMRAERMEALTERLARPIPLF